MTHRFNKPIIGRGATIARVTIVSCVVAWIVIALVAIVHIVKEGKATPIELMAVQPANLPIIDHANEPVVASIPAQHLMIDEIEEVIEAPAEVMAVEELVVKEPIALVAKPDTLTSKPESPTFDDRPLRKVRTIEMKVTAYSPDARSCGKWADGITASGKSVWTNGMKLVAADTSMLPFNTILTIDGYNGGKPVQVLDRGGAIKGNRLDVLFPTHEQAMQWGVRIIKVDVWEYAD